MALAQSVVEVDWRSWQRCGERGSKNLRVPGRTQLPAPQAAATKNYPPNKKVTSASGPCSAWQYDSVSNGGPSMFTL